METGVPLWAPVAVTRSWRPNYTQIALALLALFIGAALYLVARPAQSVMLFQALGLHTSYDPALVRRLRWLADSLPSFIHVFAFSLLSIATLERQTRRRIAGVVLFWVAINVLFELGQLPAAKPWIARLGAPTDKVAGAFVSYFLNGTFDWNDISFALCGGLAAYSLIRLTIRQRSGQ